MEGTAKPGADLLWAFQLHREHRALSKRLTAVETSAARQQDRITASEQSARSAQHERVDALTGRLRKLEDADVSEQVAGLAGELRATRHQLDQARDKLKPIEKAQKEADSKSKDRDRTVQLRLGECASVAAQTQKAVRDLEGRLQFAVNVAGRDDAEDVVASSERHEEQIQALGEQLRTLERAQGHLKALLESDKHNHQSEPAISTSAGSVAPKGTGEHTNLSRSRQTSSRNEQLHGNLDAVFERPPQEQAATDIPAPQLQRTREFVADGKTPGFAATQAPQTKASGTSKRKRKIGFEKEISQLVHGDGSLTNAPAYLESQTLGVTTRSNKKFKVEAVAGMSLRSALTRPEVQTNKIKEEPAARPTKLAVQPAKTKATGPQKTTKTVTAQAPTTTTKTKGRRGARSPKEAPVPKRPLLSTSSEIQVAYSHGSTASKQPVLENTALPVKTETGILRQDEQLLQQRPQHRRRRIEQDDSMEEFLAKCQAATGI